MLSTGDRLERVQLWVGLERLQQHRRLRFVEMLAAQAAPSRK